MSFPLYLTEHSNLLSSLSNFDFSNNPLLCILSRLFLILDKKSNISLSRPSIENPRSLLNLAKLLSSHLVSFSLLRAWDPVRTGVHSGFWTSKASHLISIRSQQPSLLAVAPLEAASSILLSFWRLAFISPEWSQNSLSGVRPKKVEEEEEESTTLRFEVDPYLKASSTIALSATKHWGAGCCFPLASFSRHLMNSISSLRPRSSSVSVPMIWTCEWPRQPPTIIAGPWDKSSSPSEARPSAGPHSFPIAAHSTPLGRDRPCVVGPESRFRPTGPKPGPDELDPSPANPELCRVTRPTWTQFSNSPPPSPPTCSPVTSSDRRCSLGLAPSFSPTRHPARDSPPPLTSPLCRPKPSRPSPCFFLIFGEISHHRDTTYTSPSTSISIELSKTSSVSFTRILAHSKSSFLSVRGSTSKKPPHASPTLLRIDGTHELCTWGTCTATHTIATCTRHTHAQQRHTCTGCAHKNGRLSRKIMDFLNY